MNKTFFIRIFLLLFVVISIASIFYVRSLYIQSATQSSAFFEPTPALESLFLQKLKTDTEPSLKVVYFWQADCACDEFVKPHFLLMTRKYQQQTVLNVDVYIAPLDGELVQARQEGLQLPVLPADLLSTVIDDVKATPSVGIWDQHGQLVYYGPHSIGYVCHNDSSLVKKVVDALLANQPFSALSVMGDGCFCPVNTQ